MSKPVFSRAVHIIDGARTPFLKAASGAGPFSAADLAVNTSRELLLRQTFKPSDFDEVVFGCVMPSPKETNIARIIALRLGCGDSVPAYTVQRNCASGMQAVDSAVKDIACGRHDLVLAGGVDAMSRAPLLFNKKMTQWFVHWMRAKTLGQRLKLIGQIRLNFLAPVISLIDGLTDPVCGLNMGQTAENIVHQFKITREEMDEFSVQSHKRAMNAAETNLADEITSMIDYAGKVYAKDTGVRADSSLEKLAKLKPFIDRKFGTITAGNSSQITDGAAALILASDVAVKQHKLKVLATIKDVHWGALAPDVMGLGPVYASTPILTRQNLKLTDVQFWEINEAFAGQVLGCIKAWDDETFCVKQLGLKNKLGQLNMKTVNIDGGAVALGHPVGASGARILLHLANILKRKKAQYGIATICIGGGQGGAMLIENPAMSKK